MKSYYRSESSNVLFDLKVDQHKKALFDNHSLFYRNLKILQGTFTSD